MIDLSSLGIDPATHFVGEDVGREHPLVVEHATGAPAFAVVDGRPVPYAEYAATRKAPAVGAASFVASGSGGDFAISAG